jgi:hypothetical protein
VGAGDLEHPKSPGTAAPGASNDARRRESPGTASSAKAAHAATSTPALSRLMVCRHKVDGVPANELAHAPVCWCLKTSRLGRRLVEVSCLPHQLDHPSPELRRVWRVTLRHRGPRSSIAGSRQVAVFREAAGRRTPVDARPCVRPPRKAVNAVPSGTSFRTSWSTSTRRRVVNTEVVRLLLPLEPGIVVRHRTVVIVPIPRLVDEVSCRLEGVTRVTV